MGNIRFTISSWTQRERRDNQRLISTGNFKFRSVMHTILVLCIFFPVCFLLNNRLCSLDWKKITDDFRGCLWEFLDNICGQPLSFRDNGTGKWASNCARWMKQVSVTTSRQMILWNWDLSLTPWLPWRQMSFMKLKHHLWSSSGHKWVMNSAL